MQSKDQRHAENLQEVADVMRRFREASPQPVRGKVSRGRTTHLRKAAVEFLRSKSSALTAGERLLLKMHDTITVLEERSPRVARVMELKYFAAFETHAIAQKLGRSNDTIRHDIRFGRAYWARALHDYRLCS